MPDRGKQIFLMEMVSVNDLINDTSSCNKDTNKQIECIPDFFSNVSKKIITIKSNYSN